MPNNRATARPWLPDEEATLCSLLNEGFEADEIAERLGRSRQAIYGRIQRFHKQRGRTNQKSGETFTQWPNG
jgi:transposase